MAKVTIKKKSFKDIKSNPSLLGFGCMRFPVIEEGKPDIDEEKSIEMIDYAYQSGVNYFDTAYPYHQGLSELFIGKALKKYPRKSFYLASKMPGWEVETVEDAKRIFFEQLKKCQVEYFEYYLCHALSAKNVEVYKIPGVMEFLTEMKELGKIHHLGFSFHDTPEVLEEILEFYPFDFVQLQINYLDWTFQEANRQYALAKKYDLPVIVMEPVRGGTLANLSDAAKAVLIAKDENRSVASWAIRYAASLDQVITVLSGMSNLEQTKDNINTLTNFKPLDNEEKIVLDKALKIFMESRIVPCTKCQYCMPCPEGVDIPKVIDIYNQYAIDQNRRFFYHRYKQLDESQKAEHCIQCGICLDKCPQKIDIPSVMTKIDELYRDTHNEFK